MHIFGIFCVKDQHDIEYSCEVEGKQNMVSTASSPKRKRERREERSGRPLDSDTRKKNQFNQLPRQSHLPNLSGQARATLIKDLW